jgi:hypothetical protein
MAEPVVGKVVDMDYHRNGISGEGFWTIIFEGGEGSDCAGQTFVATFFPNEENECFTAVLRLNDLTKANAGGCMRGDHFHDELKVIVENYEWPADKRERLEREGNMTNRRAAIEHSRAQVSEGSTEE